MAATYEPIATTTLGSAASSITFSSIPATYTDLRLVLTVKATGSANCWIQFNSDTGTNYSQTNLGGSGSAAQSNQYTSKNYLYLTARAILSTEFSFRSIDIFSYAGSTNKTVLIEENGDYNGSGQVARDVGLWRNTSAISSIYLYLSANNFDVGTTATLYGIKSA